MKYIVTIRDKTTGEAAEAEGESRWHGTNYQAIVSWKTIVKIEYGSSDEEAIRAAVNAFAAIPKLSGFDISYSQA